MFGLSFAESIVFPIPVDPLLAACIIAQPKKIVFLTVFTILSSVLGGIIGWIIGLSVGVGINNLVDFLPGVSGSDLKQVSNGFANWGLMLTFIGAFTPLPYKLIAISAGATGVPLTIFLLGSIFGRGVRFLIIALLSYYLGEKAIKFIKNNLALSTLVLGVIILIIWLLII